MARRGFELFCNVYVCLLWWQNDCNKIVVSNDLWGYIIVWPSPFGIAFLTLQMCHHRFLSFKSFLAFGTFYNLWCASLVVSPGPVVE